MTNLHAVRLYALARGGFSLHTVRRAYTATTVVPRGIIRGLVCDRGGALPPAARAE